MIHRAAPVTLDTTGMQPEEPYWLDDPGLAVTGPMFRLGLLRIRRSRRATSP